MKHDIAVLRKALTALTGSNHKCKTILGALWTLRSTGPTPAVAALIREFKAEADTVAGLAVFLRDASEALLLALIGLENGNPPANGAREEEGDGRAVMLEQTD